MNEPASRMNTPLSSPLITPKAIIFDIFLVGIFFYFMFGVVQDHVPFEQETLKRYATTYATTCVSGVFWLALQCLRVTWKDQYQRSAS